MMKIDSPPLAALFPLALGIALGVSCKSTSLNPNHCHNVRGDLKCAEQYADGSRPFCGVSTCFADVPDGCIADRPPDDCYAPCGLGMSLEEDATCDWFGGSTGADGPTGGMTMEDGSGTTGGMTTEDDNGTATDTDRGPDTGTDTGTGTTTGETVDCEGDDECTEGDALFCGGAGVCVDCGEVADGHEACAGLGVGTDACSDGVCVECINGVEDGCTGLTPVCDGEAQTCVGCSEHSDCPGTACHLDEGSDETGACFAGVAVAAMDAQGLVDAMDVADGDDVVITLSAGVDYNLTATLAVNAEVAILGPTSAELTGTAAQPSVNVGDGILYIAGPSIASGVTGVACFGDAVWLDDAIVRNNSQVGLDISGGCDAYLRRSTIRAHAAGAIVVNGATLRAENTSISSNLGSLPAVQVSNSALEIMYSTLVGNFAAGGTPDTLQCTNANGFVRNSIVLGETADSISMCGALVWENNAVDTDVGASNAIIGAWNSAWFAMPDMGDYHLSGTGEGVIMDIAQWQDGDPLTDIDGEDIETVMPSYPGYDQP